MKLNAIYIQPFLWLWMVGNAKSEETIDDGYVQLCNPKTYGCDCPAFGDNTKTMDCSDRDLSNMSQFIQFSDRIESANFRNNKIKAILQNTFAVGRNVIQLDISHNNIDFIQHSVFHPLTSLRKLVLSHNSIWDLDNNLLEGLQTLETLDLSYNRIQSWDKDLFIPCKRLKQLDLRYNGIGSLGMGSEAFAHLPQLRELNLENTGLTDLPNRLFESNFHLKSLYLNGNQLTRVPNSALRSAGASLRILDMSATNLQVIRFEDFSGLEALTELRLERIHTLQKIDIFAFSDLKNLQSFVGRYNYQLTRIDSKAFTNNITEEPLRLLNLNLRHNSLQTLSDEMLLWKSLQHMDLEGNPWICDCNMKWMAELDLKDLLSQTKCRHPHRLVGQPIKSLEAADFVCSSLAMSDSFLITLFLVMTFATLGLTAIAFFCIRKSWCSTGCYIPFKKEKLNYVKIVANKERVDLEWDHSAEP